MDTLALKTYPAFVLNMKFMQLPSRYNLSPWRVTVLKVSGGWVYTPGPIVSKLYDTSNVVRLPIVASELGST